jgi:hypothetical protein
MTPQSSNNILNSNRLACVCYARMKNKRAVLNIQSGGAKVLSAQIKQDFGHDIDQSALNKGCNRASGAVTFTTAHRLHGYWGVVRT